MGKDLTGRRNPGGKQLGPEADQGCEAREGPGWGVSGPGAGPDGPKGGAAVAVPKSAAAEAQAEVCG